MKIKKCILLVKNNYVKNINKIISITLLKQTILINIVVSKYQNIEYKIYNILFK